MDVVETTQRLIQFPSVTTESNKEISTFLQVELGKLGFELEILPYQDLAGRDKVAIVAMRQPPGGATQAGIAFFGHNDVVPVSGWNCPHGGAFSGVVAEERLWGRGACDMKGPIAAALTAISQIRVDDQIAPIYFALTGDEESGMAGARRLASESNLYRRMVSTQAVGIIGEPTGMRVVNSHKGGCHFEVSSTGVAAHSSTVDGQNANWQLIPYLNYLRELAERCDTDPSLQNNSFHPNTLSLNIVIDNEPAAPNITVGKARCRVFLRPMPETAWEQVIAEMVSTAERMELNISPVRPLLPLHTSKDRPFVRRMLELLQQVGPESVCFATDGCCFQELRDLVVIGPGSIEQAHRPDEWIELSQLHSGVEVYRQLFENYACKPAAGVGKS